MNATGYAVGFVLHAGGVENVPKCALLRAFVARGARPRDGPFPAPPAAHAPAGGGGFVSSGGAVTQIAHKCALLVGTGPGRAKKHGTAYLNFT